MTERMHGSAVTRRWRGRRTTSLATAAFAIAASLGVGLGVGTAAHADEPLAAGGETVVVAVGLPPVPPTVVETEVRVEVGLPPVPPLADNLGGDAIGEVGEPPVPMSPDAGDDDPVADDPGPSVTSSIAGAVAATASAAWHAS